MKVLVFGAGAMGSVFGAFMARTGHQVSLLGRKEHLDVIEKQGLSISGVWGEYRMKAFDLYSQPSLLEGQSFDLVIVSVQEEKIEGALSEAKPFLMDSTAILLLTPSGNIKAEYFNFASSNAFLAASPMFKAQMLNPGAIQIQSVIAPETLISAPAGAQSLLKPTQMAIILNNCKIPSKVI